SSAASDLTEACEGRVPEVPPPGLSLEDGHHRGLLFQRSFHDAHTARLATMVDLTAIRAAGLQVVSDPMHGACGRLLETMIAGGRTKVRTIHAHPDPLFGGLHPEPLEQNLQELRTAVVESGAAVGLATDGDGDRIGAFDDKGQFVSPLRIAPLL